MIILVAFAIRWVVIYAAGSIDANIDKWGRIVVGLLCVIIIVSWLLSLLGLANVSLSRKTPLMHRTTPSGR